MDELEFLMNEVAVHHKSRSAGLPQFVMNTEVHHKIILSSRPWIRILFICALICDESGSSQKVSLDSDEQPCGIVEPQSSSSQTTGWD